MTKNNIALTEMFVKLASVGVYCMSLLPLSNPGMLDSSSSFQSAELASIGNMLKDQML